MPENMKYVVYLDNIKLHTASSYQEAKIFINQWRIDKPYDKDKTFIVKPQYPELDWYLFYHLNTKAAKPQLYSTLI